MSVFKNYYYHGSIERYVQLMTYLFQDLQVNTEGGLRVIPVKYSGGEHRIPSESVNVLPYATLVFSDNNTDEVRLLNKHENKIFQGDIKQNSRVSNDFAFEYRVRCKKQTEMYQVLEQVLAAFTPSLDVLITDNDSTISNQNIKISIDSWTIDDAWEGDSEEPNYYDVLFNFTLAGYIYRMDKPSVTINSISVLRQLDGFQEEPWFTQTDGRTEVHDE